MFRGFTLRMKDLTHDDSRNYTCVVYNTLNEIRHTFTLDVIGTCTYVPPSQLFA